MEKLSSSALQDERTGNYLDPIFLELMKDPVVAADGITYEKSSIIKWFETKKPIVSPMTNVQLASDALFPNTALKTEIQNFIIKSIGKMSENIDIKFNLSSEIYKELDRVANLKLMETLKLRAPQLVVLGNESHGKSTLLERIIGLPIFPRDRNICTRCPIRVKIRRGEPSIAKLYVVQKAVRAVDSKINEGDKVRIRDPFGRERKFVVERIRENNTAYVRDIDRNVHNVSLSQLQLVDPPKPVREGLETDVDYAPLDGIRDVIKSKMDRLASGGIVADKEIVVELFLRNGMNIDILDLPGLVSTSLNGINLPAQTEALAANIIREEKDYSFFLLVNDIRVPSNQSRGCEIVEKHSLQDKTVGIFTKLDVFTDEDGDEVNELRKRMECKTPASFNVKHGWMGTCSKPVSNSVSGHTNKGAELRKLYAMETDESRILATKFPELQAMKSLGIHCIRQKIQLLYDEFIVKEWVPNITKKLTEYYDSNMVNTKNLGVPVFRNNIYGDGGNMFFTNERLLFTKDVLQSEIQLRLTHLINSSERTWLHLSKNEKLWKHVKHYREYVEKIESETNHCQNKVVARNGNRTDLWHCSEQFERSTASSAADISSNFVAADCAESKVQNHIHFLISSLKSIIKHMLYNAVSEESLFQAFLNDDNFTDQQRKVTKLDRFEKVCGGVQDSLQVSMTLFANEFLTWFEEEITSKLFSTDGDSQLFRLDAVQNRVMRKEYRVKDGKVQCQLSWTNYELIRSLPDICLEQFYSLLKCRLTECANSNFVDRFDLEDKYVAVRNQLLISLIATKEVINAIKMFSAATTAVVSPARRY